jgi:hypothetical protein
MASVAFHLTYRWARIRRHRFAARLSAEAARPLPAGPVLEHVRLASYCGRRDFPELVASWHSFRKFAGRPAESWLLSDGSLGRTEAEVIRRLEPHTRVLEFEELDPRLLTPRLLHYAAARPLGKKLCLLRQLSEGPRWIFSDSDLLYFPGAAGLGQPAWWAGGQCRFLLDQVASLDPQIETADTPAGQPVNSGFLAAAGPLDWTEALARLEARTGPYSFFTEQTVCHLACHRSGGLPLDPARCIMRNEDQWLPRDLYARRELVFRHYISSFRQKMWLQVGRW